MTATEKTLALAPSEICLEELDALLIENSHLKSRIAGDALEHARSEFAGAMKAQAHMTVEMGRKYGHDLTRYDFDSANRRLVLRQQAPPSPMQQPVLPPDAGGEE